MASNQGKNYRAKIVAYLLDNLEKPVKLDALVKASGASTHSAQTTMSHLAGSRPAPGLNVEAIIRGQIWRATVAPAVADADKPQTSRTDDRVFSVLGTTADRSLVLEATDNTLWKAVQL